MSRVFHLLLAAVTVMSSATTSKADGLVDFCLRDGTETVCKCLSTTMQSKSEASDYQRFAAHMGALNQFSAKDVGNPETHEKMATLSAKLAEDLGEDKALQMRVMMIEAAQSCQQQGAL